MMLIPHQNSRKWIIILYQAETECIPKNVCIVFSFNNQLSCHIEGIAGYDAHDKKLIEYPDVMFWEV